jgi:hypothetical protein
MRGVGSGGLNNIAGVGKQLNNVIAAAKFTTKIKANIAVRGRNRETIQSQPRIQKFNWWSLGRKALAKEHATEMVNDETIASFTIEATKTLDTRAVSTRILDDEAKIDGNALVTLRSTSRISNRTSSLVQFGLGTNWTGIKWTGLWYCRNTESELVCLSQTTSMDMAKALVP